MIATCTVCGALYEAGSEEQAYEPVRYCGGTKCVKAGERKTESLREYLDRKNIKTAD
jgi:hypothetical protein